MGRSVAKMLAEKGANIVIVSRNVIKLEEALQYTKSAALNPTTQRFHYISADLTKPNESVRVVAEMTAWNNGLAPDVVWCVAGAAHPALFLDSTPQQCRQQMDVNYWTCADMAHAILSEWLQLGSKTAGKPRHLIFTSSVVALYTVAGYAPYSPAKAAIRSLSDTLVQELLLYGETVKIHTILPGTIESAGLQAENETKPEITNILEKDDPVQTPDQVAAKSIAGLENGDYLVTVGWLGVAMRACAWGGSPRNNWVLDTVVTWVTSIVLPFIHWDLNGKVRKFARARGHPSTYSKKP